MITIITKQQQPKKSLRINNLTQISLIEIHKDLLLERRQYNGAKASIIPFLQISYVTGDRTYQAPIIVAALNTIVNVFCTSDTYY